MIFEVQFCAFWTPKYFWGVLNSHFWGTINDQFVASGIADIADKVEFLHHFLGYQLRCP